MLKLNYKNLFERGKVQFVRQQYPTRYKSRVVCTCIKTNTPHPPKDPPENYNPTSFTHGSFEIPKNIQLLVFRPLKHDDILGPKAAKDKIYKNPEYYAYHRFSHVDLFMNSMRIRMEKRLQQSEDEECRKSKESDKESEIKDCDENEIIKCTTSTEKGREKEKEKQFEKMDEDCNEKSNDNEKCD